MLKRVSQRFAPVRALVIAVLLGVGLVPAGAGQAPDLPRFESLKGDMVYMREGPSTEHRVKWVYHRKGLPVEVLAEFEVWRRVRDADGEMGWMHTAMLSRERMAVLRGQKSVPVRRREDSTSPIVAQAQPGAIGRIESCGPVACELKFETIGGWVDRSALWGIHADEHF